MTTGQADRAEDAKVRLRVAISDGYAMVKGLAMSESMAQATPEQLMAELLDDLVGPSNNPRKPSRLERVRNTRAQLRAAIEQIRALPPEAMALSSATDTETSAMTPEESDAPTAT
jgi:hypothetical protein